MQVIGGRPKESGKDSGMLGLVFALVVILLLAGAAAAYYFMM